MDNLPACIYVYHRRAWYSWRSEESAGTEVPALLTMM